MPNTLEFLPLKIDDDRPLQSAVENWISKSEELLQEYWDRWLEQPIEQYVACDFRYVAMALRAIAEHRLADGRMFCEWGCGFGVVTGIASILGFEAIGIEVQPFLVGQARKLLKRNRLHAEIWEGNFLPRTAESMADDQADHPSLGHHVPPAYEQYDSGIDDFALIFSYPWPGEAHFIQEVFRRHARPNALLLQFLGPFHVEVYRKR